MKKAIGKVKLRPAVQQFAEAMELKLRKHDRDYGKKVDDFQPDFCYKRLKDEMEELMIAMYLKDAAIGNVEEANARTKVLIETTDVANFSMMLWHACNNEGREE